MKFWGITGGIGSGKSTVLHYLDELGYACLDADQVARKVTLPEHESFEKTKASIISFAGEASFKGDQLDRAYLRALFSEQSEMKKKLTDLLHPLIREEIVQWMQETELVNQRKVAFIEAIEMFGSSGQGGLASILNGTLCVVASLKARLQRAAERDGVELEKIQSIVDMQKSDEEWMALCDLTLQNDGGHSDLKSKVHDMLNKIEGA